MNTWRVILATMVIFGTGVVTGGLLVRHSERTREPRPPHLQGAARPATPAGAMRLEFLRRAQRELELTQEQRDRLDKVIKESQDRSRAIMEPVTPALKREFEQTREEFLSVLTPAQRVRFDELARQQQRARHPGAARERATNAPPAK